MSGQGSAQPEPAQPAIAAETLHRGWRELETSIRPKSDAEFLAERQADEENTLRHYEHAVTRELPPQVRPVVERQRLAVRQLAERGGGELRATVGDQVRQLILAPTEVMFTIRPDPLSSM